MTSRPYRSAMWLGCHGVPPYRVSAIDGPGDLDEDQDRGDAEERRDGRICATSRATQPACAIRIVTM